MKKHNSTKRNSRNRRIVISRKLIAILIGILVAITTTYTLILPAVTVDLDTADEMNGLVLTDAVSEEAAETDQSVSGLNAAADIETDSFENETYTDTEAATPDPANESTAAGGDPGDFSEENNDPAALSETGGFENELSDGGTGGNEVSQEGQSEQSVDNNIFGDGTLGEETAGAGAVDETAGGGAGIDETAGGEAAGGGAGRDETAGDETAGAGAADNNNTENVIPGNETSDGEPSGNETGEGEASENEASEGKVSEGVGAGNGPSVDDPSGDGTIGNATSENETAEEENTEEETSEEETSEEETSEEETTSSEESSVVSPLTYHCDYYDIEVSFDSSVQLPAGTKLEVRELYEENLPYYEDLEYEDLLIYQEYFRLTAEEMKELQVEEFTTAVLYELSFVNEDGDEVLLPYIDFDIHVKYQNVTINHEDELIRTALYTYDNIQSKYRADLFEKNNNLEQTPVITLDEYHLLKEIDLEKVSFYTYDTVFGLFAGKEIKEQEMVFEAVLDNISVNVTAPAGAFPEGTTMEVKPVEEQAVLDAVQSAVESEVKSVTAVDITFYDADGNEIQPAKEIQVSLRDNNIQQAQEESEKPETPVLVHVDHEGEANVVEDATLEEEGVVFESKDFSVYALVYTVDFTYEVNGNTYEFSLPGGGFVSFRALVEALGILENTGEVGDGTGDQATEAEAEEIVGAENVEAMTDGLLYLDSQSCSEDAGKFVKEIISVEFSKPDLVWVGKVSSDITIGALKEAIDLEVQYSKELTTEQIDEINAQTIGAGDWALISVQPFDTEETLTVAMNNGDQFVIKVTDAQLSTNVLTADGEHFRITVTYDDDAEIPDGAVLEASEIPEGTEQYEKYLTDTAEVWKNQNEEGYIDTARFFNLEIRYNGVKIEPKTEVDVMIEHEEPFVTDANEALRIVHFADNGPEIIDELHLQENGTIVEYQQSGFSVIGTVSTVKDSGWPSANGQYVVLLQDGDDYYAIKHDGTLQKVRYFNDTVSFIGEGTTTTDYINDFKWYVTSASGSTARGYISDQYYEYNTTPSGQVFINMYTDELISSSARQLRVRDEKVYCSGQITGTDPPQYQQYTISAAGGVLHRVPLTDSTASPISFAAVSTFSANDNETDLFTQVEVESIIAKWKNQITSYINHDKTAEVVDYENRIYQIDVAASSANYEVSPSIALEFVVDASRSMFFPTSLTAVGAFTGTNASDVRTWINNNGNTEQVYFVIQNKNGSATQYAIFYEDNQWWWSDASQYNPPDDVANGGSANQRYRYSLSTWYYGNMDDGTIYTTGITGSSTGTYGTRKTWISRIEYLKQCVRVAAQVVYAVDKNAQIGLIGFNQYVTDYGTYGKDEQATFLEQLNNIGLDGGTNSEGGLEMAISKYTNASYYAEHYKNRKHVVVLVTDGAPNYTYSTADSSRTNPEAHQVTWDSIRTVADRLRGLQDDFGNSTELYTMGLSLANVGTNQQGLFSIATSAEYQYAAEDAAQIINAVTKMVEGVFVQASLVGDVKDVIDPAFYPVNSEDGRPLKENDWINLSGTKVDAAADEAVGKIGKDEAGNWYVIWEDQHFDWPTTDSNGNIVAPGWHGTVYVKAKENFLGGNGISTNTDGSQITSKNYIINDDPKIYDLPSEHTDTLNTPYVNVDELDMTKHNTEWTVYLGTEVDPVEAVKALWNEIRIKEVVSKTDTDHRISSDGSFTYEYIPQNTNDNRTEVNAWEELALTDFITLSDTDWNDLINGTVLNFDYNAYNHTDVGTISVKLTQAVVSGEDDLTPSPHDTAVTGNDVEKYTLTISYKPKGANITEWHTGSYGSGRSGNRAGNIEKDNIHEIHVFAKKLQIIKVDQGHETIMNSDAVFYLYRKATAEEEADSSIEKAELEGLTGLYVLEQTLNVVDGTVTTEPLPLLLEGESYYLKEIKAPPGYYTLEDVLKVTIDMTGHNTWTKVLDTTEPLTSQTKWVPYILSDWQQEATILVTDLSGNNSSYAIRDGNITYDSVNDTTSASVIYKIVNESGFELPSTGGPGTKLFTILGSILLASTGIFAGTLLWRKRRTSL